ncbi:hypothetical protein Ancab_034893 [Ancistrocladus abbreviatus]
MKEGYHDQERLLTGPGKGKGELDKGSCEAEGWTEVLSRVEKLSLATALSSNTRLTSRKFVVSPFSSNIYLQQFLLVVAQFKWPENGQPRVPALSVFGDSLFDSGNNNFLPIMFKANYRPYGLNFREEATGRFCNGKTVADFIGNFNFYT